MEADRKATSGDTNNIPTSHFQEKVTYRVGNKGAQTYKWTGDLLFGRDKNMHIAYVDRCEQVRLVKELYRNQIGELYSLPYHMIEFALDDSDCKVTFGLRYPDLVSVLPTRVKVLAWPMHQFKKNHASSAGAMGSQPIPARLSYAEDASRTLSLPEAYAEIVLNLPQAPLQISGWEP
ncbi:Detected protein of unknown function [Hibiscus syriacus]|uniref:Uncharacterized protein n=1 Tax=Hibiscus syriacus TaxID=106335 RepID=A0A6A3CZX9_HIBSY|nr:Detected protein of unknown function [Hibiscus syriacus]